MRYYSFAILLILALNSCASKAAIEPEGIVDNIPENWAIENPIAINISEIWWNEFQDEKLNKFLSQFLAENINLEQAMLNTRVAKQASVISSSNLFPSIGISAAASESEQNSAGFPPIFATLLGTQSDEIATFNQENYNLSLSTQWEIDLWGKIRQGRVAGKQQYLAAKYNYTYYQFSLTSEATKLYFSIIEAKQLAANAEKKYSNAKIIFDGGIMRGTDVVKAIALGADCVGIGRLQGLAAAAGGTKAIVRMLELLELEILTALRLIGVNSIFDLDKTYLSKDNSFGNLNALSAFPLIGEGY